MIKAFLVILAMAFTIPSVAQARTAHASAHHCPSYIDHWNKQSVSSITTHGVDCALAHDLSMLVANQTIGYPLPGTVYVGHGVWHVSTRQATSPQSENPFELVTLTSAQRTVTFHLHD